ncbi:bifunctional nuclease family protein [bacterium]|nr:bifunctional nuclease family protein [bacterium]
MPYFEEPPEGEPFENYEGEEEVPVTVVGVYEDREGRTFVVLRDSAGRNLPIVIGPFEALAISLALYPERVLVPRPLTHDLMKNIIEKLRVRVEKIVVDDLFHDTYYAKIYLIMDDESIFVDSRPSDAIALALRVNAPIYVLERVFLEAAKGEYQ